MPATKAVSLVPWRGSRCRPPPIGTFHGVAHWLNADGTFDANFGECGRDAKNNLPVGDGRSFLMRVYEPKLAELESYKLPTPVKVE